MTHSDWIGLRISHAFLQLGSARVLATTKSLVCTARRLPIKMARAWTAKPTPELTERARAARQRVRRGIAGIEPALLDHVRRRADGSGWTPSPP